MDTKAAFEAWLCETYSWGNDTLNAAHFCDGSHFLKGKPASDAYYMGGDFYYDGSSCAEPLFWAWRGWQAHASREAIAIPSSSDSEYWFEGTFQRMRYERDVEKAITSHGIRIKGKTE